MVEREETEFELFKGNRSSFFGLHFLSALLNLLNSFFTLTEIFSRLANENNFSLNYRRCDDTNWARMRKFSRFYKRKVLSKCNYWKWTTEFMNESTLREEKQTTLRMLGNFPAFPSCRKLWRREWKCEKPQKEDSLIPKVNRCFAPVVCALENVFSRFVEHVYSSVGWGLTKHKHLQCNEVEESLSSLSARLIKIIFATQWIFLSDTFQKLSFCEGIVVVSENFVNHETFLKWARVDEEGPSVDRKKRTWTILEVRLPF
jgi:hypothetical protein